MKRLIVALTVAFMFVAGSASAATWQGHLYGSTVCADFTGGLIAPLPEQDFTFEMAGTAVSTSSVTVSWTVAGGSSDAPTIDTVTGYYRSSNMDWDMAGIIPAGTTSYPVGGGMNLVVQIDADSTDEGLNMNIIRKFAYDGSGDWYAGSNWQKTSVDAMVEPRQSLVDCHVAPPGNPPPGSAYSLAVYGISIKGTSTTATHMEGMFWLSQAFAGAADASGSYRWTAELVPIPAAAWLLLSGLVGIVGLRRRS